MKGHFRAGESVYISSLQKRMFFSAFLTAAYTEFIEIIAFTIDTVIVCSFFGEREIAAVGLAGPVFFIIGMPAACFAGGLQTVCSQEMGRGHIDEVCRKFSQTLCLIAWAMSAAAAVLLLAVPKLAFLFGARGNAADLAGLTSQYMYGIVLAALPYVLLAALTPVAVLDNGNRAVILSAAAGAIVNVAMDIASVMLGWGLFGIGMATAVSNCVSVAILLLHFLRKGNVIHFTRISLRPEGIGEVVRRGLPSAFHSLAGVIRSIVLNALVVLVGGGIGMSVLALHGTVLDFVNIIPFGIAGALGILAGITYGERNEEDMLSFGVLAHRYIFRSSLLISVLLVLFRRQIAGFFLNTDSEGFPLMLYAVTCIAANSLMNAFVYSWVSYLQAVGKGREAQRMETAVNLVCYLALAFLLSFLMGIKGTFAAFPASTALALAGVFRIYEKRSGRRRPKAEDYLGMGGNTYDRVRDAIAYPVATPEECALLSEQIMLLCKGHRLSQKTGYFAGLAAEEITTNALAYGGNSGKGKPVLDVRVVIADGTLILRMRDNGQAFNLSSLSKMVAEDGDPTRNIGTRMICSLADSIDYYRIYGMNTTIIRICDRQDTAGSA